LIKKADFETNISINCNQKVQNSKAE